MSIWLPGGLLEDFQLDPKKVYLSPTLGIPVGAGKNLKFVEMNSGLDPWLFSGARLKEKLFRKEEVEVPV